MRQILLSALRQFTVCLVLSIAMTGCERAPEVSSPRTFSDETLQFSYPGNWEISDNGATLAKDGYRLFNIESPGDAIAIVMQLEPAPDLTLRAFVDQLAEERDNAVAETYKVGNIELLEGGEVSTTDIEANVGGQTRSGLRQEFVISLLNETVPHYADAFEVSPGPHKTFLVTQAAQEDWEMVRPGFELIQQTIEVPTSE